MLFYLDDSILEFLDNPKVVGALNSLANARRQGIHLIYASRRVFETLVKCKNLDSSSVELYKKIRLTAFNLEDNLTKFNRKITLVGDDEILNRIEKDGYINFIVSISKFDNIELLVRTNLLLEDHSESSIYMFIGAYYKMENNMNDIIIGCNTIHGGGNKIYENFVDNVNNKLILCLADTDKLSPNVCLGETYKKLKKYYNKNKNKFISEFLINERYHEIENLIPFECYSIVNNIKKEHNVVFEEVAASLDSGANISCSWEDFAYEINKNNRMDIWCYFDFKEGLKAKCLLENINNKNYWGEIFSSCNIKPNIFCCDNKEDINRDTIIIKGLRKDILKDVFEELKNIKNINDILSDCLKEIWLDIGQVIVSWTCNGKPIRIG